MNIDEFHMVEEIYYQRTVLTREFGYQRTLLLRDQEQLSRKLREKLTAVQRSATTEQLRVQTERVATLDANMTSTLNMFAVFQAKMRAAAADSPAAKASTRVYKSCS